MGNTFTLQPQQLTRTAATEVAQWTATNKMEHSHDKTKELRIRFKRTPPDIPPVTINISVEQVNSTRLGVTLTADLKWQPHIDEITAKALQRQYFIILFNRAGVESHHLVKIYTSLVRSVVEYACQVWNTGLTKQQTKQLESIQRRAMRIIFRNVSYAEAIVTAGIPTPADRRESQHRQTGGNPNTGRLEGNTAEPCSRTGNNLITHCAIFCLQSGKLHTEHAISASTLPRCRIDRFNNSFYIQYGLFHWQWT